MSRRLVKSALELLSDIGSKAHDLQGHGPIEIAKAMVFMRECGNGPMFDWLRDALMSPEASKARTVDSDSLVSEVESRNERSEIAEDLR